jgi:hypothetical protein
MYVVFVGCDVYLSFIYKTLRRHIPGHRNENIAVKGSILTSVLLFKFNNNAVQVQIF